MTSISLHQGPARAAVWKEQLRAVGLALRTEALVYVGVMAFLGAAAIVGVWRASRSPTFSAGTLELSFASELVIPISLLALFLPFGVWRSEPPSRRSYHWAMPVDTTQHTLMKVAAGWLWVLAATAVYILDIPAVSTVMALISGGAVEYPPAWEWMVPFTSATVAYLLGSVAVVGSEHPGRWLVGLFFGYFIGKELMAAFDLDLVENTMELLGEGYYGISRAIWGHELRSAANGGIAQWLIASAMWGGLALAALIALAYRRNREA